jgi:hypothetical protein
VAVSAVASKSVKTSIETQSKEVSLAQTNKFSRYLRRFSVDVSRMSDKRRERIASRRLKRAAAQKSTGLLPQRTHCYGCRPVDMATR